MELLENDLLGGDRVTLDGSGPVLASEVDRGARKCRAEAVLPGADTDEEAGDSPDTGIVLVLGAAHPRDPVVAQQTLVRRARLNRAPADWLTVEICHQAAGRARVRMAAVSLLAEPVSAFLRWKGCKSLPRSQFVSLALAGCGDAAGAEDHPEVFAACLVGWHDDDRRFPAVRLDALDGRHLKTGELALPVRRLLRALECGEAHSR